MTIRRLIMGARLRQVSGSDLLWVLSGDKLPDRLTTVARYARQSESNLKLPKKGRYDPGL